VAEGVEDATQLPCQLKWPNDVLLGGAKVAGVLVESRVGRTDRTFVVGVGINVASAPAQGQVPRATTCLADRAAHAIGRIDVIRAVLRRLDTWVNRMARGQSGALREPWIRRCGMINQRVRVQCGRSCHEGRALDVSPLDGLVLCRDDGRRVHLPAAESTVLDWQE
jgi:BirA family biotin operon repressor/biotin-[acetyl-CoA-carboxylase] ligase